MKTPLGRLLRWLFLTVVCVTLGGFAAAEELKLNDLAKNLGQGITKAKFKAVLVADFHGLDGNACSQGWYLAGQLIDAWHQHHQQFEIRNVRLSVTDLQSAESLQRAASTSVADAVVTGTIEHNSDGYLLTTSLRRAADGAVVNTVRVIIPHSRVLDLLSPEGFGFPNTAQGTPAVRAGLNGVTIPTCLYCPIPGYTQEARDAKYQGTVVLSVIISPKGVPLTWRWSKIRDWDLQKRLSKPWVSGNSNLPARMEIQCQPLFPLRLHSGSTIIASSDCHQQMLPREHQGRTILVDRSDLGCRGFFPARRAEAAAPFGDEQTILSQLPALLQLREHQLGYFAQRFKHPLSGHRHRFQDRFAFLSQLLGQFRYYHGVRQIALIQLQHIRDSLKFQVVFSQVLLQIFHGLEIRIEPLFLRVGHKNDSVGAFQDQLAAGFVENLPRNGVQMKACFESADGP